MNHTPGPWRVVATGYTGRASAKFVICPMTSNLAVAHIKHSTMSPMEANARLIAAAPELLQALLNLVGTMCSADGSNMEADLDAIDSCVADAHAAIAKATT